MTNRFTVQRHADGVRWCVWGAGSGLSRFISAHDDEADARRLAESLNLYWHNEVAAFERVLAQNAILHDAADVAGMYMQAERESYAALRLAFLLEKEGADRDALAAVRRAQFDKRQRALELGAKLRAALDAASD